jgi:hypothetical protein
MLNPYGLERIAEQRRADAERAAAAYRLVLQAERTGRAEALIAEPHVRAARLLQRIAQVVLRWPGASVQRNSKTASSLVKSSVLVGQRKSTVHPPLLLRLLAGFGDVAREIGRLPMYAAKAERLHHEMRRAAGPDAHGVGVQMAHVVTDERARPLGERADGAFPLR